MTSLVNKQLKKKAQEIGNVPPHYELEIEDYNQKQKKKGQAYFIWKNPEDPKSTLQLNSDMTALCSPFQQPSAPRQTKNFQMPS